MLLYSEAAVERAMKVQEVILRAVAKKLTWIQAAEILGVSPPLAAGAGPERAGLPHLAGEAAAGVAPRRHHHTRRGEPLPARAVRGEAQRDVLGRGAGRGHGLPPLHALSHGIESKERLAGLRRSGI